MTRYLLSGVAMAALVIPAAAFAQSTGTVDIEQKDIVVKGRRDRSIAGVQQAETPKTRGILTQQFISKQRPGQTILDTINQLPGVSFQNNDPYGSAGGTLSIRGFDASRISLTFDGIPLNDTGNYAIYSNQQIDPELIEQVTVNLGSTDIDSPTAAATGSTVNYRVMNPTDDFGARLLGSVGDFNMFRVFGQVNTGRLTKFGTKLWVAASDQTYNWYVNDFGKIHKTQYNAKLYQPIGNNGDFVSISGHLNVNRNNFGGSAPLRLDQSYVTGTSPNQTLALRTPGTGSATNRFPTSFDEIPYHVVRCTVQPGGPGVQTANTSVPTDATAVSAPGCGTTFDERYNPSNTGNIRINSRFTLAPGLVLTVDPSYQFVKANGGGTVPAKEGTRTIGGVAYTGYIGGTPYFGHDLNFDNDAVDTVTLLAPSQTVTHRYGLIASLRYDLDPHNTVRVSYSHDYGRHRQTGELGYLQNNGVPYDVFPINNPITDAAGNVVEKRDRLSFAILDKVAAEYIGRFFNDTLTINAGLASPWYKRELNNFCFTTSASGFVDCFGRGNTTENNAYATANPYSYNATTGRVTGYAAPGFRRYSYHKLLPSIGIVSRLSDNWVLHANYSKGLQVPGTDNLYNAFYYPQNIAAANPAPETSDNFDAGIRYVSPNLQAEISPWYTRYHNRLASAFDPDTQVTLYRNLGEVNKYGIDAQIDYRPIPQVAIHAFASYLKSEILQDLQTGNGVFAATKGKRESGFPDYTYGGRLELNEGPFLFGIQAKRTGGRYLNDQNLPITTSYTLNGTTTTLQAYPAKTPAYTLVDLDARVSMGWAGLNDKTYLQFNLTNLFNQFYVGGFSGGSTSTTSIPFVQIGVPRTFSASLNVQF